VGETVIAHRCRNCLWWDDKHPAVKNIPPELDKVRPGFCRKHRPGSLRIEHYYYGVQPIMDADDFCGEFRQEQA
jgi:hypothetical protein